MCSALRHQHQQTPPFESALPEAIFFRTAEMLAESQYPTHRHNWGEFVYAYSGLMEVVAGGDHYMAPSHYGLWIPPRIEHQGFNRYKASHCSLYVSPPYADELPSIPCALAITRLTRTILEVLKTRNLAAPYSDADRRLLRVLVDQLSCADCVDSYLPGSADPLLGPILDLLRSTPGNSQPLSELASLANSTPRTLSRRAKKDLGMTISEWRQRARSVEATKLLHSNMRVEAIALDLGYSSASAFIAMFKKWNGVTPDEYRRRNT